MSRGESKAATRRDKVTPRSAIIGTVPNWGWDDSEPFNLSEHKAFRKKRSRVRVNNGGRSWDTEDHKAAKKTELLAGRHRERIQALVRIANNQHPGYADLVMEAESESFKDWFFDVMGFELGPMLYENPVETIKFIQRAQDHENNGTRELQPRQGVEWPRPAKLPESESLFNGTWLDYSERRRQRIINATPPWFDQEEYEAVVALREQMNLDYPDNAPHHIDHAIPIAHPKVCGLHVHTNMQVIPGWENLRKSNGYDIG